MGPYSNFVTTGDDGASKELNGLPNAFGLLTDRNPLILPNPADPAIIGDNGESILVEGNCELVVSESVAPLAVRECVAPVMDFF